MNHWHFIIAAYGVTLLGTLTVTWISYRAMRKAEARADALRESR